MSSSLSNSTAPRNFKVGSLNATGTFKNPLEYLVNKEDDLSVKINNRFIELVNERLVDENSIKNMYEMVNTLDKDINTCLYSPRYNRNVLLENISEDEYNAKWDRVFDELGENDKKTIRKLLLKEFNKMYKKREASDEELDGFLGEIRRNMRLFDWLTYRAILDMKCDLNELHDRLVSNEERVRLIEEMLRKKDLDVLFLQEMFEFPYVPEGYQLVKKTAGGESTGMLLKTNLVGEEYNDIVKSDSKLDETMFGYVVDDLVFVSVHLNSKNRKKAGTVSSGVLDEKGEEILVQNRKNYEDQKEELDMLFSRMRENGLKIICGMDANHAVCYDGVIAYVYSAYPNSENVVYTTSKMRSDIQCQYGKRREWVKECRDTIVTTGFHVNNSNRVEDLEGTVVDGENAPTIPSKKHPFDHLLVSSVVYV